ncbi:deoxyribose-phosphate aldolase [Prevotella sp. E9-3]|uniref:deoxyribose-phosphate aldolase n=1 Tax=Prevotella sp. E9-3 TaxID=2913621 RepID=UPI001EDAE9CB|nr:deoxyribose-phosphate aldolase [Prevotella sp. E9-3]UKK48405.1 deoxyribose-phosphate aldolase [Prevotella sp. E9-3]
MAEHHHDHEHEHEHHHHAQPESRIEEALKKYNLEITDEQVREAVKKIIAEKVHENDTPEVKKFLMGSVELTTLKTTDSETSVMAFTEKVNQFEEAYPTLPHVATICVYPKFAKTVAETLEVEGVEIACVSGSFPSSQSLIEVKTIETQLAIKDGATEIDIVMPVGSFLEGDYETVVDEIQQQKEACGEHDMKVILETGCLKTAKNIKIASILSMYAGADYIKTSTGKLEPAATPEAAYVMCQAIKEYYDQTGIMIGFKPAGGLNSVMDALIYYTIVKEVLGEKWLTNKYLRLGTSRLANMLLSEVVGEEVKFF